MRGCVGVGDVGLMTRMLFGMLSVAERPAGVQWWWSGELAWDHIPGYNQSAWNDDEEIVPRALRRQNGVELQYGARPDCRPTPTDRRRPRRTRTCCGRRPRGTARRRPSQSPTASSPTSTCTPDKAQVRYSLVTSRRSRLYPHGAPWPLPRPACGWDCLQTATRGPTADGRGGRCIRDGTYTEHIRGRCITSGWWVVAGSDQPTNQLTRRMQACRARCRAPPGRQTPSCL